MPGNDDPAPDVADAVTVSIIVAVAENGVIGQDGGMAWHYPEDMRHFKETTMGHPVIMGRVTYESIVSALGEPLPGRTNIVLTSQNPEYPEGVLTVGSIEAALAAAHEALESQGRSDGEVFVAGGASVYEQFLPLSDRLYWTEIHNTYEGDTQFPSVDWEEWTETDRQDGDELSFVRYEAR